MIYFIENDYLRVGVKKFGAELTSLVSKKTGIEYLWQGDESIWKGQSPVLFPIIGRLLDDKYSYNGVEYSMAKHGFARLLDWQLYEADGNKISFLLKDNEETLKNYPFRFELYVDFTLSDSVLTVTHRVLNKGEGYMYFSIGAHPAFNCEIGDILTFDENESLNAFKIDLERSLLLNETYPVLNNSRDIVITKDIFNEDALIFNGVKSKALTLHSENHNRSLHFTIGGSPYFGIWAKPGAPYVCLEPWFGLNDSPEKKDDFSQKEGIIRLAEKEEFNFAWSTEINE